MREAILIAPLRDNDGLIISDLHEALTNELVTVFGGYTASPAEGAWKGPDGMVQTENVVRFVVATPPDDRRLLDIARTFAAKARQHSVYVRLADGEVYFVEPPKPPVPAVRKEVTRGSLRLVVNQ